MPFFVLIFRNLLRQRVRTLLTAFGISLGITTVVALGVVTDSLKATAQDILTAGGSDFAIAQSGSADLTYSTADRGAAPGRRRLRGRGARHRRSCWRYRAWGRTRTSSRWASTPAICSTFEVPLLAGRHLAPDGPNEILLGQEAASQLDKKVGDTVELKDRLFLVVGIYRTGNTYEDGGGMLPLATVQEYERKQGLMTLIYVKAKPGTDLDALTAQIEEDHPELATLRTLSDYADVDQGLQIMDAANMAISFLAVFIGGIGVMNTMVMSVMERTREFGILRAVGWRPRRVLTMVLGESILLCLIGAVIGSILAVIFTRLILIFPVVRSFLEPRVHARGVHPRPRGGHGSGAAGGALSGHPRRAAFTDSGHPL